MFSLHELFPHDVVCKETDLSRFYIHRIVELKARPTWEKRSHHLSMIRGTSLHIVSRKNILKVYIVRK